MHFSSFPSLKSCTGKRRNRISATQHRCEELSARLHSYTFRRHLGGGAFGQVFLADVEDGNYAPPVPTLRIGDEICKDGKRLTAIKIVRRTKLVKESTRALARAEAENLRRIAESGSLFFTQLRETFCDAHNLYIVTDYLQGGTLGDEMDRRHGNGGFPRDRIILIMAQLVEALSHLHALRIVHRDIKPDNVLLDACGNVVLTDLGLSRWFETGSSASENEFKLNLDSRKPERENRNSLTCNSHLSILKLRRRREEDKERKDGASNLDLQCGVTESEEISSAGAEKSCVTDTGCGTLAYAAPEMHRWESYSFPADIYSLGVVFHEILSDRLPPLPPTSLDPDIVNDPNWFLDAPRKRLISKLNPTAVHLLIFLLALDPLKRITLPELRSHPFFSGVHWPTLAAHAYTLPAYHAPPLHPLDLLGHSGTWISQTAFVDPTVVLEDGPDGGLDDAYNVPGCLEMEERRGEKYMRLSRTRTGRMVLGLQEEAMQVWDILRGRERCTRVREWAKDVSSMEKMSFKTVGPVTSASGNPGDITFGIKGNSAVESKGRPDTPTCASMIASIGHEPSSSLSRPSPAQNVTVSTTPERSECKRALRHITTCIPPKLRRLSRISTLAVFSRSPELVGVKGRAKPKPSPGGNAHILPEGEQPKPTISRLSPILPSSSPEEPPFSSSSSPFPGTSSNNIAFFVTRALGDIQHSSSKLSTSESLPSISRPTGSGRFAMSRLPSISSCPSLLPPASRSTSASTNSSLPMTPERGNSQFPSKAQICVYQKRCPKNRNMMGQHGIDLSWDTTLKDDGLQYRLDNIMMRRRVNSIS